MQIRRHFFSTGGCAALVAVVLAIVLSPAGAVTRPHRIAWDRSVRGVRVSSASALLDILHALRRPQTKGDRDPALLRELARPSGALTGTPVLSLVRLAAITPWGDRVFLVPFRPLTAAAIRSLPPRLRSRARQWRAREGTSDRLGLFDSSGGGCCSPPAAITAGLAWSSSGPDPNTALLVVPDGVATVTVRFSPSAASPHSVTQTVVVHHNIAAFLPPYAVENLSIYKMLWRNATGRPIKRSR